MQYTNTSVPPLTTGAVSLQKMDASILSLSPENQLVAHKEAIESWFAAQWATCPPPFYCSVDLRNAGFKLAPVDTNLFPAGFNNLHDELMPLCTQAIQQAIGRVAPQAKRLLLLPESHTRNMFYLENVAVLHKLLKTAGFDVRLAALNVTTPQHITLDSKHQLTIEPLLRKEQRIQTPDFDPELIILNNDLSNGIPPILDNLAQIIMPSPYMSWASRLKSDHFHRYKSVASEFAEQFDLDPWLIMPMSRNCGEIDFMKRAGEDCLIRNSGLLLQAITEKYNAYNIKEKPFVVIKADAGTYGMSVMMVHSIDELKQLNRKQRTKMATGKGGKAVSKVIIQEGVHTKEMLTLDDNKQATVEPVIYMIGHHVVGGFYRAHLARRDNENLNAPGMQFEPFRLLTSSTDTSNFYAYSVVARLALVSAGREMQSQPQEQSSNVR